MCGYCKNEDAKNFSATVFHTGDVERGSKRDHRGKKKRTSWSTGGRKEANRSSRSQWALPSRHFLVEIDFGDTGGESRTTLDIAREATPQIHQFGRGPKRATHVDSLDPEGHTKKEIKQNFARSRNVWTDDAEAKIGKEER